VEDYGAEIAYIPGEKNAVPNALSHLEINTKELKYFE